ncbi:MAG: flagellar basal-body MS-ring/collar protein FliF [Nakamurella sp.]
MKTQATDWVKKVWGDFKSFTPGQKAITIFAIVGLIVGGILFASWKSQPTYAPLYSNLSTQDAAAVVQQLSDNGTPYKLASGGSQILVPSSVVYDTRLKMSSAGLPSASSGGYALLDKEGITTSDFKQQVDFQRAIEGELAKTIEAMDGVQSAAVHLAIPKQDVFNDGSKKPTAAVMITTKPGVTLTQSQVQSVVYLVSSGVPELTADNVTVADSAGHVLAAPGDDLTGIGGADTRTQMTQDYNTRVAAALQSMLDTSLGAGHAVVTVNADLDFDKTSTTTQEYNHDPKNPALWTQEQTEKYTGTGGTGGTLGTGQPAVTPGATTDGGAYDKSNKTVTNALGTVTKSVQNTPGAVKNLAVAVLLDKNAPNLNQAAIQSLVTSAVGLNTARGDTLAIQAMAFDTSAATADAAAQAKADAATAAQAKSAQLDSWIKQGTIAGLILLVFLGTIIASKRRKKANQPAETELDDLELMTHGLPEDALLSMPEQRRAPEPAPIIVGDGGAGRRALITLAEEQPDEVARVLSSWLGSPEPAREGAKR